MLAIRGIRGITIKSGLQGKAVPVLFSPVRMSVRNNAPIGVESIRSVSQYNYSQPYNPQYPPQQSKFSLFLKGVVFLAAFGGFAYYMWWPKHTFPSSVAKILRKGLWAESDKGENDYQLALKYYIEALKHCDEIKMDKLCDEYTGIQLKIGEMFERLNMISDAAFVYNEIATLYLSVLTASPESPNGRRIKNNEHRRHLIQKDLRIAIKLVEMNQDNLHLSKAILITHLIIAQDEVNKRLTNPKQAKQLVPSSSPEDSHNATIDGNSIVISNDGIETTIQKTPEVWYPFTDEFFNAMDLLAAMCISTGDLAMASRVKVSLTESMLLANLDPDKVIMSQCNLASLLYLQAEEFEAQEIAMRRKFSEDSGVEYSKLKNQKLFLEQDDHDSLQKQLNDSISEEDKLKYSLIVDNKDRCIEMALKSYESVLQFAKDLPQEILNTNNTINETVALATYGLGVVNLHLSNYDKAERLLRESRVRSKSCGYNDLISEIERELSKLFQEKEILQGGDSDSNLEKSSSIEMDIHLKK
jgi:hypothetical protein